jgi:hypothetical protein
MFNDAGSRAGITWHRVGMNEAVNYHPDDGGGKNL